MPNVRRRPAPTARPLRQAVLPAPFDFRPSADGTPRHPSRRGIGGLTDAGREALRRAEAHAWLTGTTPTVADLDAALGLPYGEAIVLPAESRVPV